MSKTTIEVPVSQIKTSEEIAIELEKKAQALELEWKKVDAERKRELAKKVREVESNTVTGTTEIKLQSLQFKLQPLEKKDLEEAQNAPVPWLNPIVSPKIITAATAWGMATASATTAEGKEHTNKVKKWLKENKQKHKFLEEWMKKAAQVDGGELDFGEKIMIKIMAVVAPLLPSGMLGWLKDFDIFPAGMVEWLEAWEKGERVWKDGKEKVVWMVEKAEEKLQEAKEQTKETTKNLAYSWIVSHLILRKESAVYRTWFQAVSKSAWDHTFGKSGKDAKDKSILQAKQVLESDNVKTKSFNELMGYRGHEKDLWIKGNETIQLAVTLALTALEKNESWMKEKLTDTNVMSDWKDRPIQDSLTALYKWIGYEKIDALRSWMKNMNLSSPSDVASKFSGMMYHLKPDGTHDGILSENVESLKAQGLSTELLQRCFLDMDKEWENTIQEYRYTIENRQYKEPTQTFVKEMIKEGGFWAKMVGVMQEFWLWDYSSEFKNGENFTMKQILELYILTKGETDIKNMNTWVRAILYTSLTSFIIKRHPGEEGVKKLLKFMAIPDNDYVKEFKDIFATAVDRATYEAVGASIGLWKVTLDTIWELWKEKPVECFSAIAVIVIVGVLTYRASKLIVVSNVLLWIIATITGISATALMGTK